MDNVEPIWCSQCGEPLPANATVCANCGNPVAPAGSSGEGADPKFHRLRVGDVLDGKWRLESKLGAGGMGSVFLAHDLSLDRKVAVKVLAAQHCSDDEFMLRFEREARMTAKLEHPNIVPVFAVGRHFGRPFIVMKALQGMTLARLVAQRATEARRFTRDEVLSIFRQLLSGLGFIHSKGYVHRDIKAGNVFVATDWVVTLLDFGVLRDTSQRSITRAGSLLGTPHYLSPEQALGMRNIDGRADLYSVGILLYECLTLKPPFVGDATTLMRSHAEAPPPDPTLIAPEVPKPVGAVVQKALAKKPGDRYPTAAEFYAALEQAFAAPGAAPAVGLFPGVVGAPAPAPLFAPPAQSPAPLFAPAAQPPGSLWPAAGLPPPPAPFPSARPAPGPAAQPASAPLGSPASRSSTDVLQVGFVPASAPGAAEVTSVDKTAVGPAPTDPRDREEPTAPDRTAVVPRPAPLAETLPATTPTPFAAAGAPETAPETTAVDPAPTSQATPHPAAEPAPLIDLGASDMVPAAADPTQVGPAPAPQPEPSVLVSGAGPAAAPALAPEALPGAGALADAPPEPTVPAPQPAAAAASPELVDNGIEDDFFAKAPKTNPGIPQSKPPAPAPAPAKAATPRKKPMLAIGLGAGAAVLLVLGGIFALTSSPAPSPKPSGPAARPAVPAPKPEPVAEPKPADPKPDPVADLGPDKPKEPAPDPSLEPLANAGDGKKEPKDELPAIDLTGLDLGADAKKPDKPEPKKPVARPEPKKPVAKAEPKKPVARPEPKKAEPVAPVEPKKAEPAKASAKKMGKIRVATTLKGAPYWASVSVDGQAQGETPLTMELPAGKHRVHIERAGFKPVDKDVFVNGGNVPVVVGIELKP